MKKLARVALNDFRLVFRDNSLKIFLVLPLLNLVVIRYALPYIGGIYEFIQDYTAVILMLATMQGPTAFGFIYSMVMVDEKDTNVAKVYGILPVSKFWFVAFRLIPPFFMSALATFSLLLVEPFYGLSATSNLVYSALAGLVAPLMILSIAIVAKNKIEAMTWQKLFGLPLFLPILSFFAPAAFSPVFAVFPPYWTYKGFNRLIEGENAGFYLLGGFAYSLFLLVFMIKRFTRIHFE